MAALKARSGAQVHSEDLGAERLAIGALHSSSETGLALMTQQAALPCLTTLSLSLSPPPPEQ
jgi:hypothetical protein